MANTYHKIYIHCVFAVKYRASIIKPQWQEELNKVIAEIFNHKNAACIIVNGYRDHVHCLFRIKPSHTMSELMKNVKALSSKWINESSYVHSRFRWQRGYSAFSCSEDHLGRITTYIQNQEEHHRKLSFQEEHIKLLEEFEIENPEEYAFQPLQ